MSNWLHVTLLSLNISIIFSEFGALVHHIHDANRNMLGMITTVEGMFMCT